jgi:hypothetical protein
MDNVTVLLFLSLLIFKKGGYIVFLIRIGMRAAFGGAWAGCPKAGWEMGLRGNGFLFATARFQSLA